MTKIQAIAVFFVCALVAPQVLAQTGESLKPHVSKDLIGEDIMAAVTGAVEAVSWTNAFQIVVLIIGALVVISLGVGLAVRAAAALVWALLPIALFVLGGFIYYHHHHNNAPDWLMAVGAIAIVLGAFTFKKQMDRWGNELEKETKEKIRKHELEKVASLGIKIRTARFEALLKDNLPEISAGVFSVIRNGHSSGFLIAKDGEYGYALTSRHVVGGENFGIKRAGNDELAAGSCIKAADGGINAALIIVNFSAQPLRVNTNLPEPGDDVYVIGSPVDIAFEGTLTRGVVGNILEEDNGNRYIQSDVGVAPGNGGSPLLDKWGNVIGIAAMMTMQHDDSPTPVNVFIPIADVLRHVMVKY